MGLGDAAGRQLGGLFVQVLDDVPVACMAKAAGFDFLFFDGEHGNLDWHRLSSVMLYGRALGLPSLVRIPELSRSYVSHTLDMGAAGVMAPMMESRAQAELLVGWAKYQPQGRRSYSGGPHTLFGPSGNHERNMAEANASTLAIAQIETVEGVRNADEIASVPGIGALVIGPADLAISMGTPDDVGSAKELALIGSVCAACQAHRKGFGIIGSNALISHFMPHVNLMVSAIDAHLLRSAFADAAKGYEALRGSASGPSGRGGASGTPGSEDLASGEVSSVGR